jgi:beta-galactosidase
MMGDFAFYEALARTLAEMAGVDPLMEVPHGVEVSERWNGDQRLLFVLNHSNTNTHVTLDKEYREIISDKIVKDDILIKENDVLILTN